MEAQFNFQMKNRNDKGEWENIEVYYQTHCDRITAIRYTIVTGKQIGRAHV